MRNVIQTPWGEKFQVESREYATNCSFSQGSAASLAANELWKIGRSLIFKKDGGSGKSAQEAELSDNNKLTMFCFHRGCCLCKSCSWKNLGTQRGPSTMFMLSKLQVREASLSARERITQALYGDNATLGFISSWNDLVNRSWKNPELAILGCSYIYFQNHPKQCTLAWE